MVSYILSLITAISITAYLIPSVIKVSTAKKLFDQIDERKNHTNSISRLGGLAIFAGLIFALTFWSNQKQIVELQYIIATLLVIFFLGIKDDLVGMKAKKKLLGQIFAAVILVSTTDVKLTTFYGMFGIDEVPLWFSYVFTIFTCVVITNAFNLIDGIDGLASSVTIVGASVFGLWFHFLNMPQYTILCTSLIGAILGFLWYNWSPARIFMGDTGSMLVGFVMSLLAVKFIESIRILPREHTYKILSVPVFTCAVLIIPLFDTLRVFIVRIASGSSPFTPDRNHLHHILVDLGLNHQKTTCFLVTLNLLLIILTYFSQGIRGEIILAVLLIIPASLFGLLSHLRTRRVKC